MRFESLMRFMPMRGQLPTAARAAVPEPNLKLLCCDTQKITL